jgi:hypothetical protein
MKKLMTLVITMVITTMSCYAQDSTVLKSEAQKMCIWNDTLRDWDCPDVLYKEVTIVLKNEVFYVNDEHNSKYTLNTKGDLTKHDEYNLIVFNNVTDKDDQRCVLSMITLVNGNTSMYIDYKNKQLRYFFNIPN